MPASSWDLEVRSSKVVMSYQAGIEALKFFCYFFVSQFQICLLGEGAQRTEGKGDRLPL